LLWLFLWLFNWRGKGVVPGGGHCDYRDSGQTITIGRQERPSWSGRKVQAWKSIAGFSC
jgi:hypothetical protein